MSGRCPAGGYGVTSGSATLQLIRPDWPAPANVLAAVTTRANGGSGGVYDGLSAASHVGDNPADMEEILELLPATMTGMKAIQWLHQVHGKEVITAQHGAARVTADGAVTGERGLACAVLTADCLPVLFADTNGTAVGIAHAGWRGLAAGILENLVAQIPVPASQLLAWLGPAIGPCHFEIGPEVQHVLLQSLSEPYRSRSLDGFRPGVRGDRLFADLYRLARIRLESAGVHAIYGGSLCTYCDNQRFYSYRRDGTAGRMVSLIYIKPE
ncbi:MAG: peptidoglycan editing factor PgeF [Pseudohongiellaceae bacterium]